MDKEIVVFSDVHYAKNWDTIETCLDSHCPATPSFLNPNREFKSLIQQLNRSEKVGLVVNNGDSVDYHFDDYSDFKKILKSKDKTNRRSNWDHFNHELKQLNKPYVAILGNHDYRKEAYNYNIWGTNHVNFSSQERMKYRTKIGHNTFRGPLELASILVNHNHFNPLTKCSGYKKRRHLNFGNHHCLFLNSGTDGFVKLRNLFRYANKNLIPPALSFDLEGLDRKDLAFVRSALSQTSSGHFFIFQHAPVINSRQHHPNQEYQLSTTSFTKCAVEQKVSHNTLLQGGGELLNILQKTTNNVTIISSHTHTSKYFLIHKSSLVTREVSIDDFNVEKDNPAYIKQLTTLPLGALCQQDGGHRTGFLKINHQGFKEIVLKDFAFKGEK